MTYSSTYNNLNSNQRKHAARIVAERGLDHVKIGVFDNDGVFRGKYMAAQKFLSALDGGFGFCDVVLGWDSYDQLYDNVQFTGWHTGYPDAKVRVLPESCREIPWEDGMLFLSILTFDAANREYIIERHVREDRNSRSIQVHMELVDLSKNRIFRICEATDPKAVVMFHEIWSDLGL